MKIFKFIVALGLLLPVFPVLAETNRGEVLLFTYFRNNGQDGVHLAMTTNGEDFCALKNHQPIFKPPQWPDQNLTRDASVLYRDGKFRMVWTSGWKGRILAAPSRLILCIGASRAR